jgi:hypothetical protein
MNSAPFLTMNFAGVSSLTPRRAKIGRSIGSSDSPMWKRGKVSRSSASTLRPFFARKAAAEEPPGPPPMTMTSNSLDMETPEATSHLVTRR